MADCGVAALGLGGIQRLVGVLQHLIEISIVA